MPDDRDLPDLDYDREKVDETVLALFWLTLHDDRRAWKGHDWDALGRLHAKGLIGDPKSKAKSVRLPPEGVQASQAAFKKLFGKAEKPIKDRR